MKFHLIQSGVIGRRHELEQGMAGQRRDLYQRYLDEIRTYVRLADELGYASYGHNEHHLQIEGMEITSHPGMFSLFIGSNSTRLKVGTLGYVLPTHNPLRVAEEIAALDHMLKGRLLVGFVRGYQDRWVDTLRAVPGVTAATPERAAAHGDEDAWNRKIFEESVQVIKKAWSNSTFSHQGDIWTFPPEGGTQSHPVYENFGAGTKDGRVQEIGIAPLPYTDPHPKLYGAFAHSMRTVRLWAREGGKPIVLASDLDFCRALSDEYRKTAAEAGWQASDADAQAWGGVLAIANTRSEADAIRERILWYYETWALPFGQQRPNFLIGTPDDISKSLEDAHARLGFDESWMIIPQGLLEEHEVCEQLELFESKVMPRFGSRNSEGTVV